MHFLFSDEEEFDEEEEGDIYIFLRQMQKLMFSEVETETLEDEEDMDDEFDEEEEDEGSLSVFLKSARENALFFNR